MTPIEFVSSLGYLGIWTIIFLESGLFMFFFPGDSLLLATGVLASQNIINIHVFTWGSMFFAFAGNTAGYLIGKNFGPKVFSHSKSWLFNKRRLNEAHNFYAKHGPITIVLGRFIPVVRTFLPVAAGAAKMDFKVFTIFNLVGAALWCGGITIIGYFLGSIVPDVERYMILIIMVIIVISVFPALRYLVHGKSLKQTH